MEPSGSTGTTPERTNKPGFDRSAAVTRSLLGYGVLVGPFYLTVGLIQALVRDGFDLTRHPLSVLANGPGGWVQTANFVLGGLMVIAAAAGFKRVLGPNSRGVCWSLGVFGASMLAAAVFPADPVDGFPVGTPMGPPTAISTPGLLHFVVGTLGFTSLAISCFFAASSMARLSVLSGLAVLLGFFGGFLLISTSAGTLGIWFAVVAGWAWLAVISRHLYRVAPDPNCPPQSVDQGAATENP